MIRTGLILALLGAAGIVDAATTIYRCGPGGREFSQRPCVDGTVVDGTDGRTAAQRAAAARIVEQERRKAAQLERERLAQERKDALAVGINGLARPADASASNAQAGEGKSSEGKSKSGKVKSKVKEPKDFVAVEPVVKK
ncbi:MAG: hypothetical protein WA210_06660 [Burkholderiaceae bacterium]